MIDLDNFYSLLRRDGVEFISGVPDTLLNDFCLGLESAWPADRHVIAANEGNAIAHAAGYHLATGSVPLVYMQNSGMGNAVNPLVSLTDGSVYSIPMVLLIGWRGEPGAKDWPQHQRQGELSPQLLDALDIPYRVLLEDDAEVRSSASWAIETARIESKPTALLVRKNVLARPEKTGFDQAGQSLPLSREDAIRTILSAAPRNAIYVASTGRLTRELHAVRDASGQPHDNDFLNVGAMGHSLSIAAGIASGAPSRPVICLDGDGAAIMHLGSLAVVANRPLPNLLHIVVNNGGHESVGGQDTVGHRIDFTGAAAAFGFSTKGRHTVTSDELALWVTECIAADRPTFIDVRVRKGMRSDMPRLSIEPVQSKNEFMKNSNTKEK